MTDFDRLRLGVGDGVGYGGDYYPEQWPEQEWQRDVALMREAGVNLVSVGVFAWPRIEPREGEFDFTWLDRVLDLLDAHGISYALATPTASPPAWFFARHPDSRVVTADGTALGFGSRGMAAPCSPAYRAASTRVAEELASRYGRRAGLVLWHVHNEYGAPVAADHSAHAQAAFRDWLRSRYGTLDELNRRWGTAFWGQTYGEWDHVGVPVVTPSVGNPAQALDFARFCDWALRRCFIEERDVIRRHSDRPVTTNFMAAECDATDLWAWAGEVDVVSNDHYLDAANPRGEVGLALAADLSRSVAGGRPWLLLEHSTSAVNWQPRNVAKRPGEMARNSLAHLGRGADAICFFQWRASRSGAEKFHSAMVPHIGTSSRVWQEVVSLGADLARLDGITGSRVSAEIAMLWDQESFWAQDLPWLPSIDLRAGERVRAFYEAVWNDGMTVDFAHPAADLSRYRLVVAPASYLLTLAAADNLTRYVENGGTLVVSCFSAVVDENDAVHEGGFLAPLRKVLGAQVEEFLPLREGERVTVDWTAGDHRTVLGASAWAEDLQIDGAQVVGRYVDGPGAGGPAITRHRYGQGTAWYISTALDLDALGPVLGEAYRDAGVRPTGYPRDLEIVSRTAPGVRYTVLLNHGAEVVEVDMNGTELLTATALEGRLKLPGGGCAVVRSDEVVSRHHADIADIAGDERRSGMA